MKMTQRIALNKNSDAVIKMYADRAYFERKYGMLTTKSFSVQSYDADDSSMTIVMKLEVPMSAPVPGFAKKFVGDTTKLTETDSWNLGSKTGTVKLDIVGAPVDAEATMRLEDTADGCVNVIDWTISCGVPLVGKKLEKLIASDIEAKVADDQRVSNEILADY